MMEKQVVALVAFIAGYFITLLWSARAGRGDSKEPGHLALQTRQDIGTLYASATITNGLLAAILAALIL
jgi:hypothetical protein